jgi:hypothetical protein
MKLKTMAYLGLMSSLMSLSSVAAEIVISDGETVKLNETFDNNYAGWSNIAIVNGVGDVSTKKAKIDGGVWAPTVVNDGGSVRSQIDLEGLDLVDGPISVYMRVNVEDVLDNPANARFGVELCGAGGGGDARFVFQIEPGDGVAKQFSYLQYRAATDGSVTDNLGKTYSNGIMIDPNAYYTFKMTITPVDAGTATVQAYYYDEELVSYMPFPSDTNGAGSVIASTGSGVDRGFFNLFVINSRNGRASSSGSNAANFDQVVITQ